METDTSGYKPKHNGMNVMRTGILTLGRGLNGAMFRCHDTVARSLTI
jgi:hypothetical protein